jgi:hypothetical protein
MKKGIAGFFEVQLPVVAPGWGGWGSKSGMIRSGVCLQTSVVFS